MLKFVAWGGVVIQHVKGYVYTNDDIFYSVWWSVALFVMIGGYNAMASYENRGAVLVKKRLMGLLVPYFIATITYVLYHNRFLDAAELLTRLIHFDSTGPLYYVAVYVQLIIVTPVLVGLILWCENTHRLLRCMLAGTLVLITCYITTNFTNIFDIVIGGGNVFAGPWLMFWFVGMFIRRCNIRIEKRCHRIVLILSLSIAILLWQYLFVIKGLNLKLTPIFHGHQVRMTWANSVETVILFLWVKELVEEVETTFGDVGIKVLKPLDFMGQHTLHIFLYHMLFLSIYRDFFEIQGRANRWFCMAFIIIGPLLVGILGRKINNCFKTIMSDVKIS